MGELLARAKITAKLWGLRARSWLRTGAILTLASVALYVAYQQMYIGVELGTRQPLPAPPVELAPVTALAVFGGALFIAYKLT